MLKFTPISSPAGAAPLRPLHLSARRLYKFGRKREEVDYPAWFWPRSQENDDKTRRISHWHCSLEWREDGLWVVDNHAPNYTSFDQDQVTEEKPVSFSRRGVLGLAGSYFIDAMPFEASHPNGPPIANIRLWAGPAETPRRLPQGCVRFSPMSSEVAFYDVVWLLSDGTFGTSRTNPIVVEAPGLAEIQGRFYHWRGCFWMENTLGNRSVRVNSIELRSNEIVPLVSGQTIDLGQVSYRVEVIR